MVRGDALRVLVVDDTRGIHDDFRKILAPEDSSVTLDDLEAELFDDAAPRPVENRERFVIDSAYQGLDAVRMVEEALARGEPYALAFIDVRMPPGIDGIETLARIWKVDPRVQAVICTAYSDYAWDEIVGTLGHNDGMVILRKPFDAVEVLQLGHALGRKWVLARRVERQLADLETEVAQRTGALERTNEHLHLILDNVGQGFFCCDPSGALLGGHSAVVERWFGPPRPGAKIWDYLGLTDARFRGWLEVGWSAIVDDVLPLEVTLDQLPSRFASDDRIFQVSYRPVFKGAKGAEVMTQMVIVVTDVTAVVASERAEAQQREIADALNRALCDRPGFVQFAEECEALMARLDVGHPDLKRNLHTIKGNCRFFGARSVADESNALEDRLADGPLTAADLDGLRACWRRFCERLSIVLEPRAATIEIVEADYQALLTAVRNAASHSVIERIVVQLRYEPVSIALGRAAEQARAVARQLGRGEIDVVVDADAMRLDPRRWKSLWAALVHAVRNAIDHGLEPPREREARGKSLAGQLRLFATLCDEELTIGVEDDGRGVDWERVRERARDAGIAHATHADLVDALFSEGLSTRAVASEISGRGVGLGALRQTVNALGGRVELTSAPGAGTSLRLCFAVAACGSIPPGVPDPGARRATAHLQCATG
jgi:two-component system chemotaxis sensor kinase CheA